LLIRDHDPNGSKALKKTVFTGFWLKIMPDTARVLRSSVLSSSPLSKLVYGVSPSGCTGASLTFLASLIVASKISEAEEILKNVKNNPTGDFSDRMKSVVDKVFELSMNKAGQQRIC